MIKLTAIMLVLAALLNSVHAADDNRGLAGIPGIPMLPQPDGMLSWVPEGGIKNFLNHAQLEDQYIQFFLFTQSNTITPTLIKVNNTEDLKNSHFDKANPTRILLHGFLGNSFTGINFQVRNALLSNKKKYNVFCVDWGSIADVIQYQAAYAGMVVVGRIVANFIDFLHNEGGMSHDSLVVIGHSLGAHVAGFAGKFVQSSKLHMIIGLDPALPLVRFNDTSFRLCETDASFVEVIHTAGGTFGLLPPIGHLDFYINGGEEQPGCIGLEIGQIVCSHLRSYTYYAEAVEKNDFPAYKCNTYQDAVNKKCGDTLSSVRMGDPSNYGVTGYYYVPINSRPPFGTGA